MRARHPYGGNAVSHFITESCIGCTLCAKMCPVQAIDGVIKQRHVINPKRCVDCGVCGGVCSKGAILDASGRACARISKADRPKPHIDASLCSACNMCVDACGKDALRLTLPAFRGDLRVFAYLAAPDACVGCGICADTCPLGAIAMEKEAQA